MNQTLLTTLATKLKELLDLINQILFTEVPLPKVEPKPVPVAATLPVVPKSTAPLLGPDAAYTLAKAGKIAQLRQSHASAHFTWNELMGKVPNLDVVKMPKEAFRNLVKLASLLEDVRRYFGKPVVITSGYRTVPMNTAAGGSKGSYHLHGLAADFVVPGLAPKFVYQSLHPQLFTQKAGLGKYTGHTHIDARGTKARWSGTYNA